ncbi:hypothetical protein GCM10020000_75650 [Streptomyces olivoverticillatus]
MVVEGGRLDVHRVGGVDGGDELDAQDRVDAQRLEGLLAVELARLEVEHPAEQRGDLLGDGRLLMGGGGQ